MSDLGHDGARLHNAAIGLGSNLGRSLETLQKAWLDFQSYPSLIPVALSSPYRSKPVDMASANWFVNAAALIRTPLQPHPLLRLLHEIEQHHGRERKHSRYGHNDRTLDLDLLLYDDLIFFDGQLSLPHPRMRDRLFVMVPLAEIAGEIIYPGSGQTISTLLADLYRRQPQQKIVTIQWVKDFRDRLSKAGKKDCDRTIQLDI